MGRKKSNFRKYVRKIDGQNECKFCFEKFSKNITRTRNHFYEKCLNLPNHMKEIMEKSRKEDKEYTSRPPSSVSIGSTGSSSQSSKTITELFKQSAKTQEILEESMARAVYSLNIPLNCVNNKEFREFLNLMRPSFPIPSRDKLSNALLDKEFEKAMEEKRKEVDSSNGLSIVIDGWSNIEIESIIDIVFCTPKPLFHKSMETKVNAHTAIEMMIYVEEVIEEFSSEKFTALVSDNAPNMASLRSLINEKFPNIHSIGCAAHMFNLLIKDIAKTCEIEPTINKCKSIVNEIKNSSKKLSKFMIECKKFKEESNINIRKLRLPTETRFYSIYSMFESVCEAKEVLIRIANPTSDLPLSTQNRSSILESNEIFWCRVQMLMKITHEIVQSLKISEMDSSNISIIPILFKRIKTSITSLDPNELIPTSNLINLVENRRKFIIKPIHYLANLLNPRYRGDELEDSERFEAEKCLEKLIDSLNKTLEQKNEIYNCFTNYKIKLGYFHLERIWSTGNTDPIQWWQEIQWYKSYKEFSILASRIFNIITKPI